MTDPEATRRFDEAEFALILKSAAELQAHDPGRPHGAGITLSEIEAIAAEAGIDASYVQRAVAGLQRRRTPGVWSRIAGLPSRFQAQRTLPGDVDAETLAAIADAARAEFGRHGTLRDALGGIEWKARDDWGSSYVSVRTGGGSTRVLVGADRNDTAWALGLVSPIAGAVVAGIATSLIPIAPVLAAAIGFGGGLAAARLAWGRAAHRWHARVDRAVDALTSVTERPQ